MKEKLYTGINNIDINAKFLDSKKLVDFVTRSTFDISSNQFLRIDLSNNSVCLVSLCATLNTHQGLLAIGGYGAGTKQRIMVSRLLGNSFYNVYVNGTSENGAVYITPISTNIRMSVSWLMDLRTVTMVSSLPSDVTEITSSISNVSLQKLFDDMQHEE